MECFLRLVLSSQSHPEEVLDQTKDSRTLINRNRPSKYTTSHSLALIRLEEGIIISTMKSSGIPANFGLDLPPCQGFTVMESFLLNEESRQRLTTTQKSPRQASRQSGESRRAHLIRILDCAMAILDEDLLLGLDDVETGRTPNAEQRH